MKGPPSKQAIEDAAELCSAVAYVRARQAEAWASAPAGDPRVQEWPEKAEWLRWSLAMRDVEELLHDDMGVVEFGKPTSPRFRARYRAAWLASEKALDGRWIQTAEDFLTVEQYLRVALEKGWRR